MTANKKLDRSLIKRCSKSNIQEAWCGFFGRPFVFDRAAEDDFGAQVHQSAKKRLPEILREPALIFQPGTPIETPAIWTRQFTWDGRRRFARVGRRYLSVHRVCAPPDDRYTDFQSEILSPADTWIDSVSELVLDDEELKTSMVAAGYINRFVFKAKTFKLQSHFNLNVGFQAAGDPGKILVTNLNVGFNFVVQHKGHNVDISLTVSQPSAGKDELIVVTNVSCYRDLARPISLSNKKDLWAEVREAQKEAKAQFYAFCTDQTLTEDLGAE